VQDPLTRFHNLKSLQCDLKAVFPYKSDDVDEENEDKADKNKVFALSDSLPRTLEALHLLNTRPDEPIDDSSVLDFVRLGLEYFPNLKQFYLECLACSVFNTQRFRTCHCPEIKEICEERGLAFEALPPVEQDVWCTEF
jgi:hypothetical protein